MPLVMKPGPARKAELASGNERAVARPGPVGSSAQCVKQLPYIRFDQAEAQRHIPIGDPARDCSTETMATSSSCSLLWRLARASARGRRRFTSGLRVVRAAPKT
jgi:hypothetical protein